MKDAIAQDFLPQYRVSLGNAAHAGQPLCAVQRAELQTLQ